MLPCVCIYAELYVQFNWTVYKETYVTLALMLGFHGEILEIRAENIADIIENCLCVNSVDTCVAGIL
jgi:hypothetical protein